MKKVIVCLLSALLLLPCLAACTRERGIGNAEDIAREEFGMGTIFAIDNAPDEISNKSKSNYCMAVIGEKDGEELFLIVPADYDEEPYLAEWPFALSFKEMVSLLNGTVGETVISEENYGAFGSIQLYGIDYYLPDVDLSALDFLYMVHNPCSHYLLAQSGGKIVIYDTGTQQPYAPDPAAGPAA